MARLGTLMYPMSGLQAGEINNRAFRNNVSYYGRSGAFAEVIIQRAHHPSLPDDRAKIRSQFFPRETISLIRKMSGGRNRFLAEETRFVELRLDISGTHTSHVRVAGGIHFLPHVGDRDEIARPTLCTI